MNESPIKLEGFGPQDLYRKREKIFTRSVGGYFQTVRLFTGWPLLIGYFLLPWLQLGDRQAVLFDLPHRQFHIFSETFWPQDIWLLGWALMIAAFGLFTITTVVGRLWCGYTCPQTVWTAIFMWIEQFTEGARHQRIRLDSAPWTFEKIARRLAKHGMWISVALVTGITFVGYFTPIRELVVAPFTGSLSEGNAWALFWVTFFTMATYINAGWLREQVCIYMCPYARFQSAMIDANTLTVSYDYERGEPRGSRKRFQTDDASPLGDCIDCTMCVQVCPTGIDIRDGLQYECIGCAQCIDACNQVMTQMNYPQGLIRYTTEQALTKHTQTRSKPLPSLRSLGYAASTLALTIAFTWAVINRATLELDVLRDRGALYQVSSDGLTHNDYQLVLINKTMLPRDVRVDALNNHGLMINSIRNFTLEPESIRNIPFRLSSAETNSTVTPINVRACDTQTGECALEATNFFSSKEAHQQEQPPKTANQGESRNVLEL